LSSISSQIRGALLFLMVVRVRDNALLIPLWWKIIKVSTYHLEHWTFRCAVLIMKQHLILHGDKTEAN